MVKLQSLLLGTIVPLGLAITAQLPAQASTFSNGWYYVNDSLNDGSNIWGIGNKSGKPSNYNRYEINGLAIKQEGTEFIVAINSYTPQGGLMINGSDYRLPTASDTNPITFGDLFLNFSGKSFNQAMSSGDLFGVRFDARNDSGVGLGVFQNVQAKSVAAQNSGYSSLQQYLDHTGSVAGMGDINPTNNSYFVKSDPIKAVIQSGNKIGDVTLVSDFSATGLNVNLLGPTNGKIQGFRFDAANMPLGNDFIAHLFYECGNDGVGIYGDSTDVPEPVGMGGLALLGLVGLRSLRRK
jgi:MYXO-CTERM domain-containing protein